MNGSEKQIKWAESIIASKQQQFEDLRTRSKSELGKKAVDYILSQPKASFWIDYRTYSPDDMLRQLLRGGLSIYGDNYDHKATLDPQTGIITITWEEIVSDGKGGHKERRHQTINL